MKDTAAFTNLLSLMRSGKKRKPSKRALQLLTLPLAKAAREFLEAWAHHAPPHVALGEFWFDDKNPGDDVPSRGDTELAEPPRTDRLMFGTTPGGDLWALKKNRAGEFASVVRVLHDDGWNERAEASSLPAFIAKRTEEDEADQEQEAAKQATELAKNKRQRAEMAADGSVALAKLTKTEQQKIEARYVREPSARLKEKIPDADWYCDLSPSVPLLAVRSGTVSWSDGKGATKTLKQRLEVSFVDALGDQIAICGRDRAFIADRATGKATKVAPRLTAEDTNEAEGWSFLAMGLQSAKRIVVQTWDRVILVSNDSAILSAHQLSADPNRYGVALGAGNIVAAIGTDRVRIFRCAADKLVLAMELEAPEESSNSPVVYSPDHKRIFVKLFTASGRSTWQELKLA